MALVPVLVPIVGAVSVVVSSFVTMSSSKGMDS